jgi:hypothetical protein
MPRSFDAVRLAGPPHSVLERTRTTSIDDFDAHRSVDERSSWHVAFALSRALSCQHAYIISQVEGVVEEGLLAPLSASAATWV